MRIANWKMFPALEWQRGRCNRYLTFGEERERKRIGVVVQVHTGLHRFGALSVGRVFACANWREARGSLLCSRKKDIASTRAGRRVINSRLPINSMLKWSWGASYVYGAARKLRDGNSQSAQNGPCVCSHDNAMALFEKKYTSKVLLDDTEKLSTVIENARTVDGHTVFFHSSHTTYQTFNFISHAINWHFFHPVKPCRTFLIIHFRITLK